jgi:hypothetical protein
MQTGMPAAKSDVRDLRTLTGDVGAAVDAALARGQGLLRLSPTWVPRSFLHPGNRLKLDPRDTYAYGLERGGIDERWFGSTTEAANQGRVPDEGLSYVVDAEIRFTLRDAVAARGAAIIGDRLMAEYGRWPVYSKFFDNMGPIPFHMHQDAKCAALVGREGKPESYYFPPQHNSTRNAFPYTFFGLTPDTTKDDVRQAIDRWDTGDNKILNYSAAYRLEPGTGWLVGPGILHAPGSLCTYEPQWGSDVFGMYQNLCEGRSVGRDLLVKDVPADKARDLDHLVDQLDWEANVDPDFKRNHYLEPILVEDTRDQGYADRWIVYGRVDGFQWFSARELTIDPMCSCTIVDPGASSLIVVEGHGTIGALSVNSPTMIGFHEMTEDEIFVSDPAARAGIVYRNLSPTEPLVILRYFGPEVDGHAPQVGAHRK